MLRTSDEEIFQLLQDAVAEERQLVRSHPAFAASKIKYVPHRQQYMVPSLYMVPHQSFDQPGMCQCQLCMEGHVWKFETRVSELQNEYFRRIRNKVKEEQLHSSENSQSNLAQPVTPVTDTEMSDDSDPYLEGLIE